jgi:hypothetical protein
MDMAVPPVCGSRGVRPRGLGGWVAWEAFEDHAGKHEIRMVENADELAIDAQFDVLRKREPFVRYMSVQKNCGPRRFVIVYSGISCSEGRRLTRFMPS